MYRKNTKAGKVDLIVYGYPKGGSFVDTLVVINTEVGGLYGSLHLTPAEALALGRCLTEAALVADATAVQVAA